MTRVPSAWHHPLTALAGKSAVAAGAAFWLGSLLPGGLAEYHYYAALGAYSVMYPAVSDSISQASRALAAVLVGAGLAMSVQLASWTNPLTVAVAVGLGVCLGALPWLREQSSWVPIVALFVLAVGGAQPEGFALGYTAQLALGAVVGLTVNFLMFAPLPVHELQSAVVDLRRKLAEQLRAVAKAVDEGDEARAEDPPERPPDLTPARERVRRAIEQARRSRRGNPRAHRSTTVHRALMDLGETLQRCSTSVEAVAVVMSERHEAATLGNTLREETVALLTALADVFEASGDDVPDEGVVAVVERRIDDLLGAVESLEVRHHESRYVAGAVAVAARGCLEAFVAAQRRSGQHASRATT